MTSSQISYRIFLCAHQDDEVGVFSEIKKAIEINVTPVFIYLTSGAVTDPEMSAIRSRESNSVLKDFGVNARHIHFLGTDIDLNDGDLINNLDVALAAMTRILQNYKAIESLYVHSYEGGHPDHDACSVIAAAYLQNTRPDITAYAYSLYRATALPFLPYVVSVPLKGRHCVDGRRNTFVEGVGYAKCLLKYKSQRKTMLALAPFLILNWLFKKHITYELFDKSHLLQRPHNGKLSYEQFNRLTYAAFSDLAAPFFLRNNIR